MSRTLIIFVFVATAAPIHGFLGHQQQCTRSKCRRPRATCGALAAEPSSSSGGSSGELLGGTKWRCEVDFGREKGTWMEPRWGYDGERFVCTLDGLEFADEPWLPNESSSDKALRDQETVGVNFLTTGAKNRGSQMGAKKISGGPACAAKLPGGMAKVRNFPRLRFEPKGWRRVGSNPKDGSLRFFATLPEGLDFGTLQLPPGETLLFATPAWGNLLSRRGGIITIRRNVLWRVEYRSVGNWRAERIEKEERA